MLLLQKIVSHVRNQALAYYREVVKRKSVRVNAFERVEEVQKDGDSF